MIMKIMAGDEMIAFLADASDVQEGTHPLTDPAWPLQMLMMKRGKGHVFVKHTHTPIPRSVPRMQEVIVVTKGKLLCTICDVQGTDIGSYEVSAGQCIFSARCGIKVEVLEDTEFYEFKNGPHVEDKVLL